VSRPSEYLRECHRKERVTGHYGFGPKSGAGGVLGWASFSKVMVGAGPDGVVAGFSNVSVLPALGAGGS